MEDNTYTIWTKDIDNKIHALEEQIRILTIDRDDARRARDHWYNLVRDYEKELKLARDAVGFLKTEIWCGKELTKKKEIVSC